ncbi:MAG: mechanosensitive ion channel [Porticoccaceae bacterium]|nr:mechanosensitive ion channel [Porticoccaceae bacterium]
MLSSIYDAMKDYLPLLIVLVASVVLLSFAHFMLIRRAVDHRASPLFRQTVLLLLTVVALISVILALPISETARGDLLSLLGLVLTGVFALSSTTFVSNAMAGFMLRTVKSFNRGDFVRVNEHFGRVTERGLFHTEIQSEDRDLITLPNLYLTTHPVKVVRASGTIVSCELSLGYDIPYYHVEPLVKQAGIDAGLEDPFVQILALGNDAITYKVAGFCAEVKQILTLRTRLRKAVLDQLHGAGIEIVSPAFINQRRLGDTDRTIAPARPRVSDEDEARAPEQSIFDKADRAEKIDALREELSLLKEQVRATNKQNEESHSENAEDKSQIHQAEGRIKHLENILRVAKEKRED